MTWQEQLASLPPMERAGIERVLASQGPMRLLDVKEGYHKGYHAKTVTFTKARFNFVGPLIDELNKRLSPEEWWGRDQPHCPACGLRGEHECLRGSATRGLGGYGAHWEIYT